MNNIDIANGIIFQKMGIGKSTFDERLICQKKIYLLQSLGVSLGYDYNWYVHGPYSPSLTSYVYDNLDALTTKSFEGYSLTSEAERNVQRVNELENDKPDDLTVSSWYELLASLLYIFVNRESWKIEDDQLFDTLIKYKPKYSNEQCENAFEILEKRQFIVPEA